MRLTDVLEDGGVIAEIDIENELPSAWRATGESPSGVRNRETIRLGFSADYPALAPAIELRMDFNRAHPHLNPGPADRPPQPCVFAGSTRELIQVRGICGLVDRLVGWLDDAAMSALNDPATGWEPVRRDTIDDFMIVDGKKLRDFATPAGGCVAVRTNFLQKLQSVTPSGQHFSVDHRSCDVIDINAVKLTNFQRNRTPVREEIWHGNSIGLIAWAPETSPGVPFIADAYLPETVATIADLLDRAEQYGCRNELDAKISTLGFLTDRQTLPAVPMTVTLLARRPYDVIGTSSPIEICSYVIDVSALGNLGKLHQVPVRICGFREQLSVNVLRRVSGLSEASDRPTWTLVGCGSVGSKVATHLTRRGQGPTTLVDNDLMLPHNYARHALVPTGASERGLVNAKALLLADSLARLMHNVEADIADAIALSSTPEGRAGLAPAGSRLLLNTTASTVVRENLSFVRWTDRPRMAEAHLLGAGKVAYAAFDGVQANPSISDLAAESYRLIAANDDLRNVVFGTEAQAILIGQGCSAATFPMPDDRLSALTAGLSQTIGNRLDAQDAGAEICLGQLREDGLSQLWSRHAVPPWTIFENDDFSIRISAHVDAQIRREIAARPNTETGGVIVGRFSEIGNAFQVVDVIPAPADSTYSPDEFVLGKEGLTARIRSLVKNSGGALYVLGTWHNHLLKSPPSSLDRATALKLALGQNLPTLLLIALPEGYTCCIREAFDIDRLIPETRSDPNVGDLREH